MKNNTKGIIIALIVAVVLGGGYMAVKQKGGKKAEVPIISADVFKNVAYSIAPSDRDLSLCNIAGLGTTENNLVVAIDQIGKKGVVEVNCSMGADGVDVFLVAFKNLNSVPVQTDAVDLRLHSDLQSRNLYRVDVKQMSLGSNGVLAVTALVVPDALRNEPSLRQVPTEAVGISYQLNTQGKFVSTK